jgi:hypothetical protein
MNPEAQNMKVKVYWNLHRDCWSIQHKGKVIGHASSLMLSDVTFKVYESGRQRVLREKKKNVHAFACGTLLEKNLEKPDSMNRAISYNPYRFSFFFDKASLEPVRNSNTLFLGNKALFTE